MVTQLQLERPYTASDLAEIDDESNRYKIVGGELIGLPTPSEADQCASGRFFRILSTYVESRKLGMVYAAPFAVHLSEHDVVEPDIVVVLRQNRSRLQQRGVIGPPRLAY